jgi:hypothetical protein
VLGAGTNRLYQRNPKRKALGAIRYSLPPQRHHRPPVPKAIRIPNLQHPRLPSPMRKHQPQPPGIRRHLKYRLAHHLLPRDHPVRQPISINPARLLPSPPLPIHQVRLNRSFALRLPPALVPHPHRHPNQPAPIPDPDPPQKPRHLIHSSHREAHLIEALLLPQRHHPLRLPQRKSHQHHEIRHPDPDQPADPAHRPLSFPRHTASMSNPRDQNPNHSNQRPSHQPHQQKLPQIHPVTSSHDRL